MFLDIGLNILLPSFVLMKLSGPERLGQVNAFVVALAIPFIYGLYGAVREKRFNWIAALGLVNIMLTGGLRFMEAGRLGFALKEAATPAVIGVFVVASMRSRFPLVRKVLYNEKILNVENIDTIVVRDGHVASRDRLLDRTTYILASSFFLSAVLNFGLAWALLLSPVNSVEFNQELGRMTALSWPVIVVPSMAVMAFALWHLGSGLRALTGLSWEEVLAGEKPAATASTPQE